MKQLDRRQVETMGWPILEPIEAEGVPRPVALSKEVCVAGAREAVNLKLSSSLVSRTHAIFVADRDSIYLRDLASRNHTYLNDEPIREAVLRNGDVIGLGPMTFRCLSGFDRPYESDELHVPPGELRMESDDARFPLTGRTALIGSRRDCDIQLRGDDVDPAHAVIYQREGRRYIRDLRSHSHTLVNNEPVKDVELQAGDRIQIGDAHLIYHLESAPVETKIPFDLEEQIPLAHEDVPSDDSHSIPLALEDSPEEPGLPAGVADELEGEPIGVNLSGIPEEEHAEILEVNRAQEPEENLAERRDEERAERLDDKPAEFLDDELAQQLEENRPEIPVEEFNDLPATPEPPAEDVIPLAAETEPHEGLFLPTAKDEEELDLHPTAESISPMDEAEAELPPERGEDPPRSAPADSMVPETQADSHPAAEEKLTELLGELVETVARVQSTWEEIKSGADGVSSENHHESAAHAKVKH